MTVPPRQSCRAAAHERGFILVAVLWILAALAAFTGVYTVYVSDTAAAAAVRDDALRADGLATAAVELAALRLVSVPKEKRPTRGEIRFRMAGANVSAGFLDEAARIDLNTASRETLAALFEVLGAAPQAGQDYAERILDWRAPASAVGGAGSGAAGSGAPAARNGRFSHVDEIWRVADLPPPLVAAALPHLTVYAGRRGVNPELADPVVRAVLAQTTPGEAEEDGEVVASAGLVIAPGDTARVTVRITFDNGRQLGAEAVILLRDFGADPYRVLMWRDVNPREPGGDGGMRRVQATKGGRT